MVVAVLATGLVLFVGKWCSSFDQNCNNSTVSTKICQLKILAIQNKIWWNVFMHKQGCSIAYVYC
jgi:hypothetical protein